MKNTIVIIFFLFASINAFAQNDALFTQQWISRINQNPAATGNSNDIDVFLLARQQWVGFEGAPQTQLLNIHNYFYSIQSGMGLTFLRDETGVGNKLLNAKLSYAYHVNLGIDWLLSLGLSGGIIQKTFDPFKHFYINENDPQLINLEKINTLKPDFDFGFELSSDKFLLGASITHITYLPYNSSSMKISQQYFGYMRYIHPLSNSFDMIAGVRTTNFDEAFFADFSLTGMLLKKYWIGAMYRPKNAVAGMLGMNIGFVRVGYSYDYSTGKTASLAKSSHEIMVSLKIAKKPNTIKTKSPRFIEN